MSIATENPGLGSLREEQDRLRARLARTRRALRLQMALETALDAALLAVAAAAVLVAIDYVLRPGLPARRALLAIAAIGALAALAIRSTPRLRAARLDDLALAMTLDRFRPGTGQQVADVLQLPGLLDEPRGSSAPAFVRLAVRRAGDALAGSDWRALWNRPRTATRTLGLLLALSVPAAFALAAPAASRLGLARWLLGSSERWPQRIYLSVSGLGDAGRLLAPRDEAFAVEVRADLPGVVRRAEGWSVPGRGEPILVRRLPDPPAVPGEVRIGERGADGVVRNSVMNATGPARFRHELPPSSTSSTFDLSGGDDWLGPIRVERVDRPSLGSIRMRVRDPGSSEGAFRPVEDARQHPIFLPDTEVELTFVGSEPIARASVDVHPGTPPTLDRVDPRTFVGRLTLREATTLEVRVTSEATGLESRPTFLSIGLLKDREPRVTLRAQGVGAHVTPVATIPLALAATDDFGLAKFRLDVERTVQPDDKAEPTTTRQGIAIPMPSGGGRPVLDHQARNDVDLQAAPPPIGAILRFRAEAEDRCARGTQVGRSGVVQLQVVSPDELFYEILIRQRAERAKFVGAIDAAEKIGPTLATTPAAEDYANGSRTLHAVARQLDQIASRVADSLAEMKLNQVGSAKAYRLLQDGVVDPIRALNAGPSNELRGLLQSLAGGPRSPADAEKARRQHGEVVARMRAILDQMSQWESFVDVVNQVAEVIKMQQKVLQATEKARESRTQEVFDEKP